MNGSPVESSGRKSENPANKLHSFPQFKENEQAPKPQRQSLTLQRTASINKGKASAIKPVAPQRTTSSSSSSRFQASTADMGMSNYFESFPEYAEQRSRTPSSPRSPPSSPSSPRAHALMSQHARKSSTPASPIFSNSPIQTRTQTPVQKEQTEVKKKFNKYY